MSTMNPHKDTNKGQHWCKFINDRVHETMASTYDHESRHLKRAREIFNTPPSYKLKGETE